MFQTLSPRDKAGSTGIGLAIVKKIAEMNGGTAWVESEIGNGSTFYFTFAKQRCAAHTVC
jgi:signal transduction histidine kinase